MDTEEEDMFQLVNGDVDDHEKIDAICIDLDIYRKMLGGRVFDGSSTLIRLKWQGEESPTRPLFSLNLIHEGDESSAEQEAVQEILKDNKALQEFAMGVYNAHMLRLMRIHCQPLQLIFEDCSNDQNHSCIDSTTLEGLVKQFLVKRLRSKKKCLKFEFKIFTREHEIDDRSQHASKGEDLAIRSKAEFEEEWIEIEREFSDQNEYLKQKLGEQQRKLDNVSQAVHELSELQRQLQAIENSNTKHLADKNQSRLSDNVKTTKQSENKENLKGGPVFEDQLLDKPKHEVDLTRTESLPQNSDNKAKRNKRKEEETDKTTPSVNSMEEKKGWKIGKQLNGGNTSRNKNADLPEEALHDMESSGEFEDRFADDFYTTDGRYQSTEFDTYGETPYGSGFGDDYYPDDMSIQTSGMQEGVSQRSHPANSYTPCRSHSSQEFSHLQPNFYNLDVERMEKIAGISSEWSPSEVSKKKLWAGESGKQKLRLMMETLIRKQILRDRLAQSVEGAMMDEEAPVPRADDGLDTVLCLDTSGSMEGNAFNKLKQLAASFIDGIEKIAEDENIEENIALVTFGGKARVLHHLSNDYSSLKEALDDMTVGGPSPIMEGLMVGLGCLSKGGILQIDNLKQHPRLFILTDGFATPELSEFGPDGVITEQDQFNITTVFRKLRVGQMDDGIPRPIIFVPIGSDPCMACLNTLTSACTGEIAEEDRFKKMTNFQWHLRIAGDALKYMRLNKSGFVTIEYSWFPDLLSQLGFELSSEDAREVFTLAKKHIQASLCDEGGTCNFLNVHEHPDLPPLGSRVVRGPDWRWGNQDTEGPGTIINHSPSRAVYVCWDNDHINVYRYGYKDRYDVQLTQLPRILEGCAPVIGAQVERGPDWLDRYGDQDGGRGNYGVVIRMGHSGTIFVRWSNGEMYEYRSGLNGKYDVSVRDVPSTPEVKPEQSKEGVAVNKAEEVPTKPARTRKGPCVWQREVEESKWEDYTREEADKISSVFKKNPTGTCLVQRNGQSFRISFKTMKERSLKTGTTVAIRQQFL